MKWLLKVLSYLAIVGSSRGAFSISCSSDFTLPTGSFCVGIPLQCTVQLSTSGCSNDSIDQAVPLSSGDLSLQVTGSDIGTISPDFTLSQMAFQLTVIVNYYPISSVSTVRIQITSSNSNCGFNVGTGDLPVSSPVACTGPLSITLVSSDPIYPTEVEGGNIISLDLEVTASSHAIQDLAITLGNFHPGLLLLSNTSVAVSDPMVVIESYDSDIHDLSTGNFEPLLFISNLPRLQTLSVSLSFQVQPFVQPKAALYFSFHAFYYISSYGAFTFQASTPQIREYVVVSPTIRGNYTLTLPYYNATDRVRDTFPPHVGDRFRIRIPIYIPCVSTNLTIEISIPEFWSEVYTFFFTNVTNIGISTSSNTLALPSQCSYTDLSTFDSDACYVAGSSTVDPIITTLEKAAVGVDTVVIEFGEIWRTVTVGETCAGDMPDPTCSCDEGQMTNITLTGTILTDVPCENQTLADNITTIFSYTSDINTWTTSATEPSNEIPDIAKNNSVDDIPLAINASLPAIELSVSSHTGDAGDAFNITFGVKHNRAYSSFTAYDLNYTFSIDPHLEPDENITICMYNTSEVPTFCEKVPFINYTIIRYGFHDVFTLNYDRVELTLGVTIIQEVAPSISFSNPGDTEFRSQPEDNPWDLTPITCTNESSGSVRIDPVVLDPWFVHWSDVESTLTESPTSTHYITINEQFNMTILACMPESFTSIRLFVFLPEISSVPLVTVNDAYVTFVGSELYNTTLFEGDSLNSTENITLNDAQTAITFFFGPEVLIPKDNVLIDTEQCFEIGLHCTVSNHPSLVDGERISYQAYVQTDFNIRTSSRYITLNIEEPVLPIFSEFLSTYDAGDAVTLVLAVVHSSVTAYRVNLTMDYPTEYFFINPNATDAVQLYKDGILQPNSTADIDDENGTVVFRTDSLASRQVFVTVLILTVKNNVENAQSYIVPHYLEWYNLPYGLEGGRNYSASGEQDIPIKSFQLSMEYSTSDENTPGNMVQLQEYISVNVSVTIPEGISPVTVQISYINAMADDYLLIIDYGEVVHIGASISNQLVLVGDTHVNSSRITLNSSSLITFELGQSIVNAYDNIVDAGDMFVLNIGAYISNTGTRLADQIIALRGEILEPPTAVDMIELVLVHPQLQLSAFSAEPLGPWDGGDYIVLSISFAHMPTTGSVAYDVLIAVEFEGGDALTNLTLFTNSFEPSGCSAGDEQYTMIDNRTVKLSHLLVACTAGISLTTQLQDTDVVSGEDITIDAALNVYYATTSPSITSRVNYGRGQTLTISMDSVIPQLSMNFMTSDVNTPGSTIQLEEFITMNVSITLPEGLIPSLTVQISQIEMLPIGYLVQIVREEVVHIGQYINNLLLSVGDTASSGNITITQNSHIVFNFGQNILNTHDNVVDSDDVIIVHIEAYVSTNSTTGLENQTITFHWEILETPSSQDKIQFELVHPQLQLNNFSVEPLGPWDGGDNIELSITFSHVMPITGYVAYDVLIIVEFERGDALANLTLFTNSFEPRGCSNEEYSIIDSRKVLLTHLLAGCTADISFTAELPDSSVIAGENITLVTILSAYYGTSSTSNSDRINYAQGQTLMVIVGSKTPQLSIELSTSDEYTPGSIVQLQEVIGLNVSVTLPEGLTSSLTVELSQVGMLSPNYTVSVTRGEILHVGESISNLTLSEGDILSNSSAVAFTEMGITINFGQNILNTHDNVIDFEDVIIVLIEVYVSTSDTEPTNQSAIFRAEILEDVFAEGAVQFELVHPKLQLSTFYVEPSGPLDGGDAINLHVTFNHVAGGYVAYDVLLLLELDGGETLSNLTLLRGSLEPSGCSSGDEDFTVGISSVTLSKFLVTCRAELSFTAVLSDSSVIAGQNITILASLVSYYVIPSTSVFSRIPYGNRQTLSFSIGSDKVHQTLNTSVSKSLDTLDVVHTVVFPEGKTPGVTVEYSIVASSSSSTIDKSEKNFTIETIVVNPITDASNLSISNLGNIVNPSNNEIDANDTAVITSKVDITKRINFTLLATTIYGISDSLSVYSEACFQFLDTKINIIERDNVVWVVLVLFFGIFIGISITVICFILRILRNKRRMRTVAPALIAAVMGKGEREDKGIFAIIKIKRPLISSLLVAMPVEQWHKRDDTYECTEAEYISEVEGDLFHLEGVLINMVVQRLLETQISLSKDKILQLNSSFQTKANHLRSSLRNGMVADMQGITLEYGTDKILKGKKLAEDQEKHLEHLKQHLPLDMDSSADALDQLSVDNEREREELLSKIEIEMKEAEQEVVHQYMSHYLLGLKAIATNLLHDIPRSNNVISKLNDEIDRISKFLLEETSLQEDLSLERNERQKKALLQKKLIDERDMKWKNLVLEEMEKNVDEMQRLGMISMEDKPDIFNGMKDKFIAEFEKMQSERDETEANITNKASNTLQEAECHLADNCPQHGLSDVDIEIREWHAHQLKREDTLRQIETDTIDELSDFWKEHKKKRTQVIENHVSGLSVLFLSKGMQLRDCDRILREHAQSRKKLREELEASRLIQMAKFQARLDQHKERLAKEEIRNQELHTKKREMERKILQEGKESLSDIELMEQYHKDVADLQKSLALEKLRIHLKTKEKLSERKKRKFEAVQRKYLQTVQQNVDGSSEKEALQKFLNQRKEVAMEIDTRGLEEERRKAEEDLAKEKEMVLKEVTDQAASLLRNLEMEQEEQISVIKENHNTYVKLQVELENLTPNPMDKPSFAVEAGKLLDGYKEQMTKISEQFEEEKKKSVIELERKMRQRRMQRERTVMELTVQEEPLPGIKNSKFKEVVCKVMLDFRMKQLQQHYTKELSDALERLEQNYHSKRNEAFEKLERKFEVHLTKVGRLSQEELVDFFKKFDSWQTEPPTARELQTGRRRMSSVISKRLPPLITSPGRTQVDPLLGHRQRLGELPPLAALSRRRGTIS